MSPDCQTSSEYLLDSMSSFSFHILEGEGKIPMAGFSNALGVFIVRTILFFSHWYILDSFIYLFNKYWLGISHMYLRKDCKNSEMT